jgi:hypothetical protein
LKQPFYLDPIQKEFSKKDSMDSKHFQGSFEKSISILIKSAKNFELYECSTSPNPYFTINWDSNMYYSSDFILRSTYPAWNCSFSIPINDNRELE